MKNIINKVHNVNCIDFMKELPDNSVDLILTDPPFGVDFNKIENSYNRKKADIVEYIEVTKDKYPLFSEQWIDEASKLLKKTGTMYVFSGFNNLEYVLRAARKAGLHLINQIIWHYSAGMYTTRKFVTSHYNLLMFCKHSHERTFNTYSRTNTTKDSYGDRSDVWSIQRESWRGCKRSRTKLPREIVKKIIEYSSNIGDVVFDPFLGSGQTCFMAKENGRQYLGCELSPSAYDLCRERLETNSYLIKGK